MSPNVARSLRPAGLVDAIRLIVAGGPRDPAPARAASEVAVQGAIEEALETTVRSRSMVREHERHRSRGRSRMVAGLTLSAATLDGYAVAAAAPADVLVGVALERDGWISAAHERFFLTAAERRAVSVVGRTALWTLKAAAWKALAASAVDRPPDLELLLDPSGAVRLATLRGEGISLRSALVAPWPGYLVSIVWATVPPPMRPRRRALRTSARPSPE